jgi:hypothetical protein
LNLCYRVLNDRYSDFLLPARSSRKKKKKKREGGGTYTSCPTAANIFGLATAVVDNNTFKKYCTPLYGSSWPCLYVGLD